MKRIQRKRTKGWIMPENVISVTRPGKWGNIFVVGQRISDLPFMVVKHISLSEQEIVSDVVTPKIAKDAFRYWLLNMYHGKILFESIHELKDKNIACWCKEGEPCHGDVLLELAND